MMGHETNGMAPTSVVGKRTRYRYEQGVKSYLFIGADLCQWTEDQLVKLYYLLKGDIPFVIGPARKWSDWKERLFTEQKEMEQLAAALSRELSPEIRLVLPEDAVGEVGEVAESVAKGVVELADRVAVVDGQVANGEMMQATSCGEGQEGETVALDSACAHVPVGRAVDSPCPHVPVGQRGSLAQSLQYFKQKALELGLDVKECVVKKRKQTQRILSLSYEYVYGLVKRHLPEAVEKGVFIPAEWFVKWLPVLMEAERV